jgi:CheY-like chemotaxis protein
MMPSVSSRHDRMPAHEGAENKALRSPEQQGHARRGSEPCRSDLRLSPMPSDDRSSDEVTPSRVLVVEPNILVRTIIADYLRDCGYRVFEGVTADDVLTVLESGQKIDAIFAEVQLSGSMDGFGLAQWVREKHPDVDVTLTSGIARAAEKARDLCDEGPLEKPYHPQEVVRRINILLERRRTAPQA